MTVLKSVFLGKNWRSKPLVFSLMPRSHDEYGCAKKVFALSDFAIFSCSTNSDPLSKVRVLTLSICGFNIRIMALLTTFALRVYTRAQQVKSGKRPVDTPCSESG